MEIDQAVKECGDRRLQAKYQNAVYVIGRAFALYEFDQVAFSFNGGKDSTVLLHLLRAGYFLHKVESECSKGNHTVSGTLKCPIRTIYFESPCAFREIDSFTYDTATAYDLQLETISLDFKSGLESLLKEKPTKAIFLGTRIGDPNAIGQEQFSPSSPGWPPFMRVNPILDWSYRDVWDFILTCKVKYCSLYDQGYTSIGSIYDTVPNVMLSIPDSNTTTESFKPAYMLLDGRLERAGRTKKKAPKCDNSPISSNGLNNSSQIGSLTASIIVVGDEILFGHVEDKLAAALCKKLPSIGWRVTHVAVVPNNVDLIADAVEKQKNKDDMVFLLGGLGPLHSDVSMAGVARAFGVRLAPDEEFEEYILRHLNQPHPNKRSEMALLPEGITELLHHMNLPVPLIKCQNVIILTATNTSELEIQWDSLIELPDTPIMSLAPFVSKHLTTTLSSVETAQAISKMCLEFSDLYIGCHQKTRNGSPIVSFVGKDIKRIDSAIEKLVKDFSEGAFSEVSCT